MESLGLNRSLDLATITVPRDPTLADTMYDRVMGAIRSFEEELDQDHEVGARLTNLGTSFTIAIESVGYHNPHLFTIYGRTPEGHRCTLLQHVSQLNILLLAVPAVHKPPRRIGFRKDGAESSIENAPDE